MDEFEEIELILWDGDPEDIYALAGMDIDYRYTEGLSFSARFGNLHSRCQNPFCTPNCVELLGETFNFRDVEFIQIQESTTLYLGKKTITSFTASKPPNDKWNGLFMFAGETFCAIPVFVHWINPDDIGKKHMFAIPGSFDLEGKYIACLLNDRGK